MATKITKAMREKAAAKGITIDRAETGSDYPFVAFCTETDLELWGSDADELLALMLHVNMMIKEHGFTVEQDGDQITILVGEAEVGNMEADLNVDGFNAAMENILIAIQEAKDEAGVTEEEDEPRASSVVPDKYKQAYRDAGHAGHCGDWLAVQMNALCKTGDTVDISKVEALAEANGVGYSKLNRTSRGWQGRFRMTVRNMLTRKVASRGALIVPWDDTEIKAPEDWCRRNAPKGNPVPVKKIKAAVAKEG